MLSHYAYILFVLQWAFKLNGAPVTAETWHLKGHILLVNKLTPQELLQV